MTSIVLMEADMRETLSILSLANKKNMVYFMEVDLSSRDIERLLDKRPPHIEVRRMSSVVALTYFEWFGIEVSAVPLEAEGIDFKSDILLVHCARKEGSWSRITFRPTQTPVLESASLH